MTKTWNRKSRKYNRRMGSLIRLKEKNHKTALDLEQIEVLTARVRGGHPGKMPTRAYQAKRSKKGRNR